MFHWLLALPDLVDIAFRARASQILRHVTIVMPSAELKPRERYMESMCECRRFSSFMDALSRVGNKIMYVVS